MKRSLAAVVSLGFVVAVAAVTIRPALGDDAPGLVLFKKNGCNECHSISALGVQKEAKKKAAEPAATDTTAAKAKKKKNPPDLSGVGLEHDAKWISAFLNKEETLDGEKHEKRFKGTEAERRTVASWLGSLKTEVKKAPAGAKPQGDTDKDDDKTDKQGSGG